MNNHNGLIEELELLIKVLKINEKIYKISLVVEDLRELVEMYKIKYEISYIDLDNGNGSNKSFKNIEDLNKFVSNNNVQIYQIVKY